MLRTYQSINILDKKWYINIEFERRLGLFLHFVYKSFTPDSICHWLTMHNCKFFKTDTFPEGGNVLVSVHVARLNHAVESWHFFQDLFQLVNVHAHFESTIRSNISTFMAWFALLDYRWSLASNICNSISVSPQQKILTYFWGKKICKMPIEWLYQQRYLNFNMKNFSWGILCFYSSLFLLLLEKHIV